MQPDKEPWSILDGEPSQMAQFTRQVLTGLMQANIKMLKSKPIFCLLFIIKYNYAALMINNKQRNPDNRCS